MSKKLSKAIKNKLEDLIANVGDMALKRRARRIVEELDPQDGDRIIDIGCGNGYYTYLLSRLPVDLKLVGLDNSEDALEDARKFIDDNSVQLVLSDVNKTPFRERSFDKAVMSEVIEHLEKPTYALREIRRLLKPGGYLVLTTTNRNYPFFWDPVNWFLDHFFATHIESGFWAGIWNQHTKLFTDKELRRIVEKSGFEVVKLENLTHWSLPFNHYLLNLAAKLLYDNHLPRDLADSISKFKNKKKPAWIRFVYWFVNTADRLNDISIKEPGVSIFIKAT